MPSWIGEGFIFRFKLGSALEYMVLGAIALSTGPRMIGQDTAGCNYSTDHERQARLLSLKNELILAGEIGSRSCCLVLFPVAVML